MNEFTVPDPQFIQRLLDAMANDILPLTENAVTEGNKVFGAALLLKSDNTTYLAETNNEIESPLHHGEMHLLKRYYEIPGTERVPVSELIFLSSHEPCSMCLSAITWAGFDNFFYFFSHEGSRDEFGIPHDLNILKEVFRLEPGQYNKQNAFWRCQAILPWIHEHTVNPLQAELLAQAEMLLARYSAASAVYQSKKSENEIPLN